MKKKKFEINQGRPFFRAVGQCPCNLVGRGKEGRDRDGRWKGLNCGQEWLVSHKLTGWLHVEL